MTTPSKAPYDPAQGVSALAHASHVNASLPEASVPSDILCRGWLLKKRRKKMQGYARRYFILTSSGMLSYSFDPKSPIRDSILLRQASLSSSERRRDIHIDSGTSTFHVRALTQDDFAIWIGACRKFVNVSGEIEHEEPEPVVGRQGGHTRSYSRAASIGVMSDQKAMALLSEMEKTLKELEEAVAMVKEDDSKKKHGSSKPKKEKEVKEKEKDKEGLFGLFHHKKGAALPATGNVTPPDIKRGVSDTTPDESETIPPTPQRVSFTNSTTSAPASLHSYLTSTVGVLKMQHSALVTLVELRSNTPTHGRAMSPMLGAVDLSRSRSVSAMSTRRHSTVSEVTWFDAPEGGDEFFLDANDESQASGATDARQSDEEEDEVEEVVGENESSDEEQEQQAETAIAAVKSDTSIVRRTRLPAPNTGEEGSLFAVLKKNVGKDLSTVSFPVSFNEPISVLQRLAEDVEYVNLLEEAVQTSNPVDRLALVAAFAISGYACTLHRASRKPFNPMLGETFEEVRLGFIAEKVSHHPPIMACHAHGEGWEYWCTSGAKNKFWGKSLEIIPVGAAHVKIGDEVYSWERPSSFMRNLIAGSRYLEHVGPMTVTSSAGYRCDLDFKEGGFWGSTLNHVGGPIRSPDSKNVSKIEGTWHEALSQHLDTSGSHLKVLWRPHPFPPFADQYFGFTAFTITLNEVTPDLVGVLPPTDSRLRPDQRAMEEGRIDDADQLKIQLEEGQRARKRERDAAGEVWTPQWFEQDAEGEWKYKGGYWETRKTGKWGPTTLW